MPDIYKLARGILFRLDAEKAHHWTLAGMKMAQRLGLVEALAGSGEGAHPAWHQVEVMGLDFPNRVGLAAGMDKAGEAVNAFGTMGFGHVEVGTVTPRPQPGNDPPRLFRLPQHRAIINRLGFNNPGVVALLANLTESRQDYNGILGINIGKNFDTPNERALDDYLACFDAVYAAADYVTVNLSSPNTKGLRELQAADTCSRLIAALQEAREQLAPACGGKRVPLAVKIAPDLSDDQVRELAGVFRERQIDGVIATNTTLDRSGVAGHPRAVEAGGLSGAPLRQRSTEVVRLLREAMGPDIPIIGVGGILSAADALEKRMAGADLVQIYTGLVYQGPRLVREIAAALAETDP